MAEDSKTGSAMATANVLFRCEQARYERAVRSGERKIICWACDTPCVLIGLRKRKEVDETYRTLLATVRSERVRGLKLQWLIKPTLVNEIRTLDLIEIQEGGG